MPYRDRPEQRGEANPSMMLSPEQVRVAHRGITMHGMKGGDLREAPPVAAHWLYVELTRIGCHSCGHAG
jgi:hypothetical protein